MKRLLIAAVVASCVSPVFSAPGGKSVTKSAGEIPVKHYAPFGPARTWTYGTGKAIKTVDGRFVGVKGGVVTIGQDGGKSETAGTKLLKITNMPLAALSRPDQEWIKGETARRAKDKDWEKAEDPAEEGTAKKRRHAGKARKAGTKPGSN